MGHNIKIGFQEVGLGDMYWINLALSRDRWAVLVRVSMNSPAS